MARAWGNVAVRSLQVGCAIGLLVASVVLDARTSHLRALTQSLPSGEGPRDCFAGDAMRLRVLSGTDEVVVQDYCSAYGRGDARLLTDNRSRSYVLLTYGEGHGTRATTDYLQVYELIDGELHDRGRLVKTEPIGIHANLTYDFSVNTIASGGLVVVGRSRIDGPLGKHEAKPPQHITRLLVY